MSKVALVTGAARGIGLATAKKFLSEGWQVVMLDIDGETQVQARDALGAADNTLAVECDVSDPDQVAAAVEASLAKFGRIDALVNNAGIAVFKPVVDTSFEEWSRVLAVNLNGPFICSQACIPTMRANGGGSIVNITSISGTRASMLRVAYGTSKAALMHLTKQQAAELGNYGIRVNAVSPGPVDTAMAKEVHTPDIRADYHDAIPLNRYGTEEELAEAVFFLSSDKASYINGHTLNVDGGFAATGIGLPSVRNT
ncbi:MAG: SDR family oxidoreductase [Alphaproteobacteria bacterium]|jgi:NAD(P)-dependent dehydrogenase (short-subunit alcohol dehydrogenase family)|nr:SDR family oxidoreductase [Alphaproteobacteria bacterium]MBT4018617.1 SDR family oxidoreductase [Alphaproteobacteria bacterium]MBT5158389.1 SDR family oxidoreductase [Alphaproteobacteria bacterium]MBT6385892.1 SDR family oxidoreductase [Alphaproteobacteria bacterium]